MCLSYPSPRFVAYLLTIRYLFCLFVGMDANFCMKADCDGGTNTSRIVRSMRAWDIRFCLSLISST